MPRQAFSIQQVYLADGFADDCDELIHRCSRVDVLTYHTFCVHYKEMNFASIYQGRTSNAEIAELSEEVIHIAKYYMVLDTSNFEESVAGLFLVYSLLNLQPYPRFAALRLVPEDMPAVERIQRVARRDRRLDVLYILGSVLIRGPVQYQADNRSRGMEGPIRKNLENFCNIDITGVRPKGVYFRQNEELDLIRDVNAITKRYSHAKKDLKASKERKLNYINDNLAEELSTSLKMVIDGTTEEKASESITEPENRIKEIKNRAMQNAVGVVRHLDSAQMRSPEKKKPKETESTTPSKTKAKRSRKRRAQKQKATPKRKRRRKSYSSTSNSSAEYSEKESGDSCLEDESSLTEIDKDDEQIINVEIDALPTLITTESEGRTFEIEIIDEMKEKEKKDTKGYQTKKDGIQKKTNKNLNKVTKENEIGKGETAKVNSAVKDTVNEGDVSKKGDKMTKDDLAKGAGLLKGNEIKKKTIKSKGNETKKRNKIESKEETKKIEDIGKDEVTKKDSINEGNNNKTPKVDEATKQAEIKKLRKVDESKSSKEITKQDEINTSIETDVDNMSEEEANKKAGAEKRDKKGKKKRGRPKKEENSNDEAPKKPMRSSPRLRQLTKRELKKPILKSKFKKMGMLEVANFKDKD